MTIRKKPQVTPLDIIANPKGDILHAIKMSSPGFLGFGEAYFSRINHGAIKGWKRHKIQTLNLVVPIGTIIVVIYDEFADENAVDKRVVYQIGSTNYARLTIPPGYWVAFMGCQEENMLMNIADGEHDPSESDNLPIEAFSYNWNCHIRLCK